jgi:two-component sensor histidine kinase
MKKNGFKEIHHRVKNNLQIVMSLLSSQSAYLENSAAIEAIKESQNRVQAIALIHQKLYKSSNVASINMPAYIATCSGTWPIVFDTRKRHIKFEQIIEPINLDLAQTVPLGLILNESVTNAIKYAFNELGGVIVIALQLIAADHLLLTIADDGKGFPNTLNVIESNSLGMEMMKALSKQLGAEFRIDGQSGVRISVEFAIEQALPVFQTVA